MQDTSCSLLLGAVASPTAGLAFLHSEEALGATTISPPRSPLAEMTLPSPDVRRAPCFRSQQFCITWFIPQIYEEGTSSVHTEPAFGTLSVAINSLPSPRPCSLETKRCTRVSLKSRMFTKDRRNEQKVSWGVSCKFVACCLFIMNRSVLITQLRIFWGMQDCDFP